MWLRENTQPNTEVKQREKDRGTRQRRDNEHRRPERYKVMNAAGSAPGKEQKFMDFLVGQQMCLLETDFAGCVVFSERYSLRACDAPPPPFIILCCNISSCQSLK